MCNTDETPDRDERRRRREVFAADRIRSTMIGAGSRPLPWWGPFDGADAIGRTLLLLGLWVFGMFSRLVISIFESGESSEYWDFQDTVYTFIGIGFLFFPTIAGLGILLRRGWGIVFMKAAILVMGVLAFPVINEFIYSNLDKKFGGAGVMAFGLYMLFIVISIPAWKYWDANHVRYQFSYVRCDTLEKDLFVTTRRIGIVIGVVGLLSPAIFLSWVALLLPVEFEDYTGGP